MAAGATYADAAPLIAALNALPSMEIAYAEAPASPPVDIPPFTPNFESSQGYLDPAPTGINARFGWTVAGGRGAGVRIVDVERAWQLGHEDLPPTFFHAGTQSGSSVDLHHGTAVLGQLVAGNNGYGITGIVGDAQAGVSSYHQRSIASAIRDAAAGVGAGGFVLLEVQVGGPSTPSTGCGCASNCCDCVPVEYNQAEFDAIAQATANGVIVVEAAGNGATNLDDPVYNNRFNRATRDSRAILVGAGNSWNRAPSCFTNFGGRLDVQGWGDSVATLGYGSLFDGGDPFQLYTGGFSGTSSASPIVTGAAASIQGISLANQLGARSPLAMRQLLASTGTPQGPDARQIGPLPNLRAAIGQLLPLQAEWLSQTVPTTMVTGQTYSVTLTVRNPGAIPWSLVGASCNAFRLGSNNPQDNFTWGRNRAELPSAVAPGGQVAVTFTVTAPTTPGVYNFQWRMLQECVEWFGPSSPNVAVTVQPPPPTAPAAPSGLGASYNTASRKFQLSWVDNSSNEGGFTVEFSYSGRAFSTLATVGRNTTTHTSGVNPPEGSYQFRVRAFNGGLTSAWSNTASLVVLNPTATTSIAWIQPAESSWGPGGTLTAAGYAANGSGGVQLVWRERSSAGVWGPWNTVSYQAVPGPDTTWSNTISSGNPTNICHWFDAYTVYSGVTSAVFHFTGAPGCPGQNKPAGPPRGRP